MYNTTIQMSKNHGQILNIRDTAGEKSGALVNQFPVINLPGMGLSLDLNSVLLENLEQYKHLIFNSFKNSLKINIIEKFPLLAVAHYLKFPTKLDIRPITITIKDRSCQSPYSIYSNTSSSTDIETTLNELVQCDLTFLYYKNFVRLNLAFFDNLTLSLMQENDENQNKPSLLIEEYLGSFPKELFNGTDPFLDFINSHKNLERTQLNYLLITRQLACLTKRRLSEFLINMPWYLLISQTTVDKNFVDMMVLFVKIGANINSVCPLFGGTLLHTLLANEQASIAKLLFSELKNPELKFDFSSQCKSGKTILMWAVVNRDVTLVHEIISLQMAQKQEVGLNLQDNKGRTALHLAYMMGDHKIIYLLSKAGCDASITDQQNQIAVMYAQDTVTTTQIQETLNEYGIDANRWEAAPHNYLYGCSGNDMAITVESLTEQGTTQKSTILITPGNLDFIHDIQQWLYKEGNIDLGEKITQQIAGMTKESLKLAEHLKVRHSTIQKFTLQSIKAPIGPTLFPAVSPEVEDSLTFVNNDSSSNYINSTY